MFPPSRPTRCSVDLATLDKLKAAKPHKVGQRVPDKVEVMTGWRAWDVNHSKGELRLESLGNSTGWKPKKALHAKCAQNSSHLAPEKNCQCGVWSFDSLEKLISALGDYIDVPVFGKVSLWGRVWECENGYRAEYAYPAELWLPDEALEQLGYIYGVPVRTA